MGLIGNMLRRREPRGGFRTIDGGHPAPFPDMTDEQLYNYEMAFNVPHKTFDRPPGSSRLEPTTEPVEEEITESAPDFRELKKGNRVLDSARFTARAAEARAREPEREPEPVKTINMPDVSGQPDIGNAAQARDGAAVLDFNRPVRVITTRQPVEIITTRARHPVYKVHGYIGDADVATVFTLDGRLCENGPRFLENVPEQRQLYLNIYLNGDAGSGERYRLTQHASQQEADAAVGPDRLRCICVQLDQ